MKARILDISNAVAVINKWGQFSVSPRFGFNLARVAKTIEPILSAYEAERLKLLNSYGKPPESGIGSFAFDSPNKYSEFNNALVELLGTETELAGVSQIPIKVLEDEIGKNDKFAPTLAELISISWLFDEVEK